MESGQQKQKKYNLKNYQNFPEPPEICRNLFMKYFEKKTKNDPRLSRNFNTIPNKIRNLLEKKSTNFSISAVHQPYHQCEFYIFWNLFVFRKCRQRFQKTHRTSEFPAQQFTKFPQITDTFKKSRIQKIELKHSPKNLENKKDQNKNWKISIHFGQIQNNSTKTEKISSQKLPKLSKTARDL